MRTLLFFHAPWCKRCYFYEQQFIEPLKQNGCTDKVKCINVQDSPFMADKYLIDKIPAVVLLDNEVVKMRRMGAIDINEIAKFLKGGDNY